MWTMRNLGKQAARMTLALLTAFLLLGAANAGQTSAPAQDALQAYEDVLSGARTYLMCDTLENTVTEAMIQPDVSQWYGMIFEAPLHYAAYAVTDLDGDESPEVLLQLTDDFGFELLRYQDGLVYGYPFVARAMEGVTDEGDIHGSNGAANYGWYRARFNGPVMETTVVCWRYDEGAAGRIRSLQRRPVDAKRPVLDRFHAGQPAHGRNWRINDARRVHFPQRSVPPCVNRVTEGLLENPDGTPIYPRAADGRQAEGRCDLPAGSRSGRKKPASGLEIHPIWKHKPTAPAGSSRGGRFGSSASAHRDPSGRLPPGSASLILRLAAPAPWRWQYPLLPR